MTCMFYDSKFNQDISNWCVEKISSEPGGFASGSPLLEEYYPIWGTCPLVVNTTEIDNTESFTIYPNPANTFLTIENGTAGVYYIEINSLNGRLLYNREYNKPIIQLDLSSFQKGVYIITIRSRDQVWTEKIIKL